MAMSGQQEADFDVIKRPAHYIGQRYECWQIVEDWGLGFHLGNVLKYVLRAERKGARLEDLKKARAYLLRMEDLIAVPLVVPGAARSISPEAVAADYKLNAVTARIVQNVHRASVESDREKASDWLLFACHWVDTEIAGARHDGV
jgi:hypothetical protein